MKQTVIPCFDIDFHSLIISFCEFYNKKPDIERFFI